MQDHRNARTEHQYSDAVDALFRDSTLAHFSNLHISDPEPSVSTGEAAHSTMSTEDMHPTPVVNPHFYPSAPFSDCDHGNPNDHSWSDPGQLHGRSYSNQGAYVHVEGEVAMQRPEDQSMLGAYPQRGWQSTQHLEYNPLYAAASNVLGIGLPPTPLGRAPSAAIRPSQQPDPSLPGMNFYQQTRVGSNPPSSIASLPLTHVSDQEPEIEPRPSLYRAGTSASVTTNSQKSKAVDLSSPPYTKEYIDQYKQRIKNDPDPEAHFLYAKYLIDAAKHIRATAKDQRAGKKYGEFLIAESLKVIRRLATQGDTYGEAQFFLANCYGTGALGLQVDHERAYHLYLQAAKQNHPAATYRVAVCNEIGAGTRREPPRAAAFYRKAASLGDTAAMYKLGMILLHGSLGEQKNAREAISWLKRAAEQADEENPHALHELGLLYEKPDSQLVPYDPAYAKGLFTQAAQLGYTPAQYKLGQCYEYGILTCPVDPRRSIAWYTKAAEKGDAEAELALSGWYLTGSEGVLKQSDSEAYLWARRAANKGLGKAEYAVGYYAEVGIGIKQDIEFAKRWYMRAAAQGNKRAMNRLTELKRMGNKRSNAVRPTRQQAKDECTIC
ncbi:HCP-like protein [Amanita muscaria]